MDNFDRTTIHYYTVHFSPVSFDSFRAAAKAKNSSVSDSLLRRVFKDGSRMDSMESFLRGVPSEEPDEAEQEISLQREYERRENGGEFEMLK